MHRHSYWYFLMTASGLSLLCNKPSICSFESTLILYLLPPPRHEFFPGNEGEKRWSETISRKNTSKLTYYFASRPVCHFYLSFLAYIKTAKDTSLCYLTFYPADFLYSLACFSSFRSYRICVDIVM